MLIDIVRAKSSILLLVTVLLNFPLPSLGADDGKGWLETLTSYFYTDNSPLQSYATPMKKWGDMPFTEALESAILAGDWGKVESIQSSEEYRMATRGFYYNYRKETLLLIVRNSRALEMLLENGMDPDFNSFNKIGKYDADSYLHLTPLVLALLENDFEKVKLLVKYGASLRQPGVLFAAIYGGNPETLIYLLQHGLHYDSLFPLNCDKDVEFLCLNYDQVVDVAGISKEMHSILKLHVVHDFLEQDDLEQRNLDIKLIEAVYRLDQPAVFQLLSQGANPNLFLSCGKKAKEVLAINVESALQDEVFCSGGLLADALYFEKDQPIAEISRLLVMFGATVRDPFPPPEFFFRDIKFRAEGIAAEVPAEWSVHIADADLAIALRHYDQARFGSESAAFSPQEDYALNALAATNWKLAAAFLPAGDPLSPQYNLTATGPNELTSTMFEGLALKKTAERQGLQVSRLKSPVCSCVSLEPDPSRSDYDPRQPFTPYCQKLAGSISEKSIRAMCY